jgi:DNA mismatch endonuclease (patch repair protein)
MDTMDRQARSSLMGRIRGTNTKPELVVRRLAHRLGFRFRLHRRDLPGSPDLVFPGLQKVVFVHGCYWHRHPGCRKAYEPKSNVAFWAKKFAENVIRDERALADLRQQGWDSLVVWECEVGDLESLASRLRAHLKRTDSQ